MGDRIRRPRGRGRHLKPTGFKPAYLRACFDVLSGDPPVARWRTRPRSHFSTEVAWKTANKSYAGKIIRPTAEGRSRVFIIFEGKRHTLDVKRIIAEIGITPLADREVLLTVRQNTKLASGRAVGCSPQS